MTQVDGPNGQPLCTLWEARYKVATRHRILHFRFNPRFALLHFAALIVDFAVARKTEGVAVFSLQAKALC